jgi:Na+/melibiose symporter-like transporter
MLICALGTKEVNQESSGVQKGFMQTLKEFFGLKEFRNIVTYYVLSMVGFDIIMGIFIFYVNDTLGFGGGDTSMIFVAIPLVVAILSAPIWVKLSQKYSKHKIYAIAAISVVVILLTALLVKEQSALGLGALCFGVGLGMSAIQILPFSSLPDVVEVDEAVHGVKREGAFYGVTQFFYKFASGFSMWLVMTILGIFGYQETYGAAPVVQPTSALVAIRFVLALLPGIIFIISTIFAYRANLGRDRFNAFKEDIEKKKEHISNKSK